MRVPLPAARMIAAGGGRLAGAVDIDARASSAGTSGLRAPPLGQSPERWWHGRKLADQDSNLDKQNQNLLCYRYTIGQLRSRSAQPPSHSGGLRIEPRDHGPHM